MLCVDGCLSCGVGVWLCVDSCVACVDDCFVCVVSCVSVVVCRVSLGVLSAACC